ncbi:MAG: type II toxin-antitoxin system RelE/ParE family toxin [Acidimicrobiales bacterium]
MTTEPQQASARSASSSSVRPTPTLRPSSLRWPLCEPQGLRSARHLKGDIYEVRADGERQAFRVLFANEGKSGRILLSLDGFSKKTQKTPPEKVRLAERRLADRRRRARPNS